MSRARVLVAVGTAYAYVDDTARAMQTWHQARDSALQAGNPFLATAAIELLAGTQLYQQGHLREAAETLQEVIDLGTLTDGSRLPFTGTAHALLAEIHLEWNDQDTALDYLRKGIELIRLGGIGYSLIYPLCTEARLEQAAGNAQGALEALRMAEQALETRLLWHMIVHLASRQVRVRLWQGDLEAAARWARLDQTTIRHQVPRDLPLFLRAGQQIAVARVYLIQGLAAKVLATLGPLRVQEEAAGRKANLIEIDLLQALALAAQGKVTASLETLERSVTLAEPEGYVRLYLEEGEPLAVLLREVVARGGAEAYAQRLLEAFPKVTSGGGGAQVPDALQARDLRSSLTEPLTPRELEVLQLICEGLSNREIAVRLTVTLNTVKKHSSHVYGKLGVVSRAQAIVRARELGLC